MNALWIDILSLAYSACPSFTHPYPRKCQWMPTGFSATKTDKNQEIISIVAFCRLNMVQHTLVHIRAAHCCWLHAYVTAGWAFTSRQDSKETKWHEIEWKHKPGIHFWNLDNRTSLSLHHVWVRWALAMEKILFSSVGVGRFLRLQLKMHQLTCTKLYQSRVGPVESNTCVPSQKLKMQPAQRCEMHLHRGWSIWLIHPIPILNVLGHWWTYHGIFSGVSISQLAESEWDMIVYGGTPGMWYKKNRPCDLGPHMLLIYN